MKELSILNAQRSTSFRIMYCVLVRSSKTTNQTLHGNKDWNGSKHLRNTETLDRIDGEPMEFEWNIFPGFNTLQLSQEVQEFIVEIK